MFGLIDASSEVRSAERAESDVRMSRLAQREAVSSVVVSAARDAAQILRLVEDDDERVAWLATYALAMVNLLEDLGVVEVTA
jgi:hypothetical protein